MHVQSCCFAHLTYCFLTFPLSSSSWFRKVPINENQETRSRLSNRLLRKLPEDPGSCHVSIRVKNAVYTLRYLAGNPSSFFSCSQTPHGQCNRYKRSFLLRGLYLVPRIPRPYFSARPMRFGSSFCKSRIRHRNKLTEKAWEDRAVQGLGTRQEEAMVTNGNYWYEYLRRLLAILWLHLRLG